MSSGLPHLRKCSYTQACLEFQKKLNRGELIQLKASNLSRSYCHQVLKMNLVFTTVYNLVEWSLAAIGILPPVLAAAAQSVPDIGIIGNPARLLKQNSYFSGFQSRTWVPLACEDPAWHRETDRVELCSGRAEICST